MNFEWDWRKNSDYSVRLLLMLNKGSDMFAVEFETSIDNGIVHIPEIYKTLQKIRNAKVIVMVEDVVEEENHQELVFDQFLKSSVKVDDLAIFSRNELHER